MRVLVVEDDSLAASEMQHALRRAGFEVEAIGDGSQAIAKCRTGRFDLMLLDVVLPGLNGLEVCSRLRIARINLPIIIVSERRSVTDRVWGLDAGADGYLCKPFDMAEMVARVCAMLRRNEAVPPSTLQVGDLLVNTQTRQAVRGSRTIDLSPLEYELVELLARHTGQVVSRATLMAELWQGETGSSNVLEAVVCNLRRKVDNHAERRLIHTIYRQGYMLGDNPHCS